VRQGTLADDSETWNELQILDDARLAHYSRTGHYRSMTGIVVIERARRYLSRIAPAVSGQKGRAQFWSAVVSAVHGFELEPADAEQVVREYNRSCQPPFSDAEVLATCWRAHRKSTKGEFTRCARGHLLRGER
jgi:hypothetical protein